MKRPGYHDSATVAPQGRLQQLGESRVSVGYVDNLLPHRHVGEGAEGEGGGGRMWINTQISTSVALKWLLLWYFCSSTMLRKCYFLYSRCS